MSQQTEEVHGYDVSIRALEHYKEKLLKYLEDDKVKNSPQIIVDTIQSYIERTNKSVGLLVSKIRNEKSVSAWVDKRRLIIPVMSHYLTDLLSSLENLEEIEDETTLEKIEAEIRASRHFLWESTNLREHDENPPLIIDFT